MTALLNPVIECRPHFPALNSNYIFAENAGGSQCLKSAVDKISDYLLTSNVQLGVGYSTGQTASKRVAEGPKVTAEFINAKDTSEIIFGSNSTQLACNLATCLESTFKSEDEVIVSASDHECNIGPWVRLAERKQLKLQWWKPRIISTDETSLAATLHMDDLVPLLNRNTQLVAFTATSNILGETNDVATITSLIKGRGGSASRPPFVIVDCVAYAPHHRIDVQKFGCDFALFSYYKVYGPHISVLYAEGAAQDRLSSLAHYFFPTSTRVYKLQPGGANYESSYASTAVSEYIQSLAPVQARQNGVNESLDQAFERIHQFEEELIKPLIDFLLSRKDKGVRIVGPETYRGRCPTVSFVVIANNSKRGAVKKRLTCQAIVKELDDQDSIFIQYGSAYANRLMNHLGIDEQDGVVRVSLVHYNTKEEVHTIIQALAMIIDR